MRRNRGVGCSSYSFNKKCFCSFVSTRVLLGLGCLLSLLSSYTTKDWLLDRNSSTILEASSLDIAGTEYDQLVSTPSFATIGVYSFFNCPSKLGLCCSRMEMNTLLPGGD